MKKIVNAILSMCLVLSLVACSSKKEEWIDNDVNNIKITPERQEIYDKAVEPYLGLDLVHDGIDIIPEKFRGYKKGKETIYRYECRDSYNKKLTVYVAEKTDGSYYVQKIEDEDGKDVTDSKLPKIKQ